MKKVISMILVLVLSLGTLAFAQETPTDSLVEESVQTAEVAIKLFADNRQVKTETVVVSERTLIPLRALLETINAQVDWINETQQINVTRAGKTVTLQIGSNIMVTPDGEKTMDVAPILQGGTTTYAPLRAISEEFGLTVDWDNGTKTILVTTPDGCPYVDFYEGATLGDLVAQGLIDAESFTEISTLDYEENKDKLYIVVYNSIPLNAYAKMQGFETSELKEILSLDAAYPDDAKWGDAIGDTPFGTYLYNVVGLGASGLSIDEAMEIARMNYGLGTEYTASTPFKYVRTIVDGLDLEYQKSEAEKAAQQEAADLEALPKLLENKIYFTITMNDGTKMKGELYPDLAPETVANFVKLVNAKFYDGLIFHRVIDGFMIQGGGFDKNYKEKEADPIKGEFYANGVTNALKHEKGVISMARTNDPNSASSQFFIMDEANSGLDGQYAAFGKITSGLDVVDKISQVETETKEGGFENAPKKNVVIKTIRINK